MFFLQVLTNGLSLGVNYALVALGLTLIFGVMGILNFTHGALLMLGGYCVYYTTAGLFALPYWTGLIISFVLLGLFGCFYEKVLLRRYRGDILICLIITLALSKILQGSAQAAFGLMHKAIPPIFGSTLNFGGVYMSTDRLFVAGMGLILLIGTLTLIDYTKIGTAIRAVSEDNEAALLQGISVGRIYSFGMFISCGLAGLAGALMSLNNPIDAYMGDAPLITCFIVMIIGGLGSIAGTLMAAGFIGILESFLTSYFGSLIAGIVNFSILMLFLLIRPKGIFGE
jgi:branched-chain amino acid transport system permease protein